MASPREDRVRAEAARPADRGVVLQREQAIRRLAAACDAGRLTTDEMAARIEAAQRAATYRELAQVTGDLPGPGSGAVRPPRRRGRRLLTGFLGLSGRFPFRALAPKVLAVAVVGEVVIDLRRTPLTSFHTQITAAAVAGEVLIIVPEGIRTEVDHQTTMIGYVTGPAGAGADGPLAPRLRVSAIAVLGDVRIQQHSGS